MKHHGLDYLNVRCTTPQYVSFVSIGITGCFNLCRHRTLLEQWSDIIISRGHFEQFEAMVRYDDHTRAFQTVG